MPDTIVKADHALRRTLLWLCGLITIAGTSVALWGVPAFLQYLETLPSQDALVLIEIIFDLVILSVMPLLAYLFLMGRNILRHGRFPPPGMKVLRDTPIVRGPKAKTRGMLLLAGSVLTGGILIGMLFQCHALLQALLPQ